MATEEQRLCEAVASWLLYKSLTGLSSHLNESSMGVPIAEFLASQHGREIESERQHPRFKSKSAGRPKQIDFVRTKTSGTHWHAAYECKYQNDTKERLIADICRLLCLGDQEVRAEIGTPKRFFVFAGKRNDADVPISLSINSAAGGRISIFNGILRRSPAGLEERLTCRISDLDRRQVDHFVRFAKTNEVKLPSVFVSELKGLAIMSDYACSIWQIMSSKGSKLLSHEELRLSAR